MKTLMVLLTTIATLTLSAVPAAAQTQFTSQGFNDRGAFQMTLSAPGDVEASTNLQSWTKLASLSQPGQLGDVAAQQLNWRFYRLPTGGPGRSNLIGFVRITIPRGGMAMLGNLFASPLRLDTPEGRNQVFGSTNPPVKVSLYGNGAFIPHTLDRNTGIWTPALRPIQGREGFLVENIGSRPLTVRLSGVVPQGQLRMSVAAGASLVVPPVPQAEPVALVLGMPAKDGMQIDYFNEETQRHMVSTFDALDGAWIPKLPEYQPGRSVIIKSPDPVNWSKTFSVTGQ